MRNFVELPGGKRIKRLNNRKDGSYQHGDRDDDTYEGGRSGHDSHKERRESRLLMRRIVGGEDVRIED